MINTKFSRRMILHELENFDQRDLKIRETGPIDRQKLFQSIRSERKVYLNEVPPPRDVSSLRREIEYFDPSNRLKKVKPNSFQSLLQDIRKNQKRYLASLENRKKLIHEINEGRKELRPVRQDIRKDEFLKRSKLLENIKGYIVDLRETIPKNCHVLRTQIRNKEYKLRKSGRQVRSRRKLMVDIRDFQKTRRLRPRKELLRTIRDFDRTRLLSQKTLPSYPHLEHHRTMAKLHGVLFRSLPTKVGKPRDFSSLLQDIRTLKCLPRFEESHDTKQKKEEEEEVEGEEEDDDDDPQLLLSRKRKWRRRGKCVPRDRTRMMSQIRSFCPAKSLVPRKDVLMEIRLFHKRGMTLRPKGFHKGRIRIRCVTELERLDMFEELAYVVGCMIFRRNRNVVPRDRSSMRSEIRSKSGKEWRESLRHVRIGGKKTLWKDLMAAAQDYEKRHSERENVPTKRKRGRPTTKDWGKVRQEIRQNRKLFDDLNRSKKPRCKKDLMTEIRDYSSLRKKSEFWKKECLDELVNGVKVLLRETNTIVRDNLHRVFLFNELQPMNEFLTNF